MIEPVKLTYSSLGKIFVKQINTIKHRGEKQLAALEKHGKN